MADSIDVRGDFFSLSDIRIREEGGIEYAEVRDGVVKYMEDKGYRLEKEEGENLTFRNRSFLNRLSRMLEDRITLTRTLGGFEVEGLRKDTIRIIYGLENALRKTE